MLEVFEGVGRCVNVFISVMKCGWLFCSLITFFRVYSEIAKEIISYTNCTTKLMINGRVKGCVQRVKWIDKWLVS